MNGGKVNNSPKIRVFSTEKISDPTIDMAAVCSVCNDPFVKHVKSFAEYLSKEKN